MIAALHGSDAVGGSLRAIRLRLQLVAEILLCLTLGMVPTGDARLVRQVVRGNELFHVVWDDAGIEQRRVFSDLAQAESWLGQVSGSGGASAAATTPVEHFHDMPTDIQISEQTYRGNVSYVVSWEQAGLPRSRTFESRESALREVETLRTLVHVNGNAPTPAVVPASEPQASPPLTPRRVLVICPDAEIRARLVGLLFQQGHQLEFETDEANALASVQRVEPDAVLVTLNNPKVPGLQICRQIKRSPGGAAIDVILVCPSIDPADQAWGLKQGARAFLTEPFTADRLAELLRAG